MWGVLLDSTRDSYPVAGSLWALTNDLTEKVGVQDGVAFRHKVTCSPFHSQVVDEALA